MMIHDFLAAYFCFQKSALLSCDTLEQALNRPEFAHKHYQLHGFDASELIENIRYLIELERQMGIDIAKRISDAGKIPFKFQRFHLDHIKKLSRSSKHGEHLNLDVLAKALIQSTRFEIE